MRQHGLCACYRENCEKNTACFDLILGDKIQSLNKGVDEKMASRTRVSFSEAGGLEEYLGAVASPALKRTHGGSRTCWEIYNQLKINLKPIQENVAIGAMADAIRECMTKYQAIYEDGKESGDPKAHESMAQLFASEHVVFLNDHGPDHISKVIERAYSLIVDANEELTEMETFVLLCAIQIHDIGNVLGRAGHEKKLMEIFETNSASLILDTAEKRIIKTIAMVHGGRAADGSKDTISSLRVKEPILGHSIRTRYLAAILRFADELADDSTRANRVACDLNIVGTDSQIYHDYSRALHSVNVERDEETHGHKITLCYELLATDMEKTYSMGGTPKYLLDEIYDRTLKMEQERRYCMKFMYQYIYFGKIEVMINVYGSRSQCVNTIKYTLEDISYPDNPLPGSIKIAASGEVPTGEEELKLIKDREAI